MTRVYVSVGSNIDREKNILSSLRLLKNTYPDMKLSPIYESEAVGFNGDPFYNFILAFDTDEAPLQLSRFLRDVEQQHGRERAMRRFASRTLDLDLLTYGDQIIDMQGLQIPRPEIVLYAFVLLPLAKLAPNELHPSLNKTYQQLWQAFDRSGQNLQRIYPTEIEQGLA